MTAMKEDQQRQQKARYAKKHLEGDLENFHNVPFGSAPIGMQMGAVQYNRDVYQVPTCFW